MEKRFILFMVLAAAIMGAWIAFEAAFGPKRPEKPVAEVPKDRPGKEKDQDPAADGRKRHTEEPGRAEKDPTAEPAEAPLRTATSAQPKWITLGSVDPKSPYRMLVTFNSRGAAIERVELANPKYRDLEDFSGYLGHLALTNVSGGKGCRVNVVGPGTPAALAVTTSGKKLVGLQEGDVLIGAGGQPIANQTALLNVLEKTKPGQKLDLKVERQGHSAPLDFQADLIRRPLEVIRPELEVLPSGESLGVTHPLSCLLSLSAARIDAKGLDSDPLRTAHWEAKLTKRGNQEVAEFSYQLDDEQAEALGLPGPVEVIKRYLLASIADEAAHRDPAARAYHLQYEIEIRNLHDEAIEVAYVQDGPNGLPTEGWWYTTKISPHWGGAGARDIVWRRHEKARTFRSASEIFHYAVKNKDKPTESLLGTEDISHLDYVGVDAQYFSAVLIPTPEYDANRSSFRKAVSMPVYGVENLRKVDLKRLNVSFRLTSDLKRIPAEGSYKQSMWLFAGPKDPQLLDAYGLYDVLEYGWFRMVSVPLSWLLHFLKTNIFFNYGLAIVALTVIVRGCMFPLSLKAAKNAKLMQEMAPELKKVTEKYKDDLEKRTKATQEVYRKYNFNPLSGCGPMFLQLPIFLGLYRSLSVDIELRQAALIPGLQWASNLAGPDKLIYWKSWDFLPEFLAGEAAGWLGPYFNILPLVSVAFLLVHQKLFTPPATDEQTKMTHDMMKYMTLFMGVLFFKVPAGLCIYFITSSLWSVVERMLLGNKPTAGTTAATTTPAKTPPSSNGASARRKAAAARKQRRK